MESYIDKNCDYCDKIARTHRHYQYLLSSLSHEVRNPLTLIYSSLQLIEKSCPDIAGQFLWAQIKTDIQDTICLLQDISKPELSNGSRKQKILVSPILGKTAMSCRAFMEEQHVVLTTDIEDCLPAIYGSEIKFKEAILNLLLNACDAAASKAVSGSHSQTAEQSGHVHLSAHLQDQELHIHIRDNGCGISASDQAHIFEPYVTHKAAGTGLGLSIAQTVATQLGGTLTIDTDSNAPDSYTDFCMAIPV